MNVSILIERIGIESKQRQLCLKSFFKTTSASWKYCIPSEKYKKSFSTKIYFKDGLFLHVILNKMRFQARQVLDSTEQQKLHLCHHNNMIEISK